MPTVKRPSVLASTYFAAKKVIAAGKLPTLMIPPGHTLYRSVNPNNPKAPLPAPEPGGHVSKLKANALLTPPDGLSEWNNRFSGPSYNTGITPVAGFYCVLQQQALINESMYYSQAPGESALSGRCVIRMRVMRPLLVAELSGHNGHAEEFLKALGPNTIAQMRDPDDCSVARGIALAIAEAGYCRGLSVQTVRASERSVDEHGDNLVLFTSPGTPVQGLDIERAYYYHRTDAPAVFQVASP